MNILLVVTGLPDDQNPARSVYNLNYAHELSSKGHTVNIIYLRALKPGRKLISHRMYNDIGIVEISCIIPQLSHPIVENFTSLLFKYLIKNKLLAKYCGNSDIIHCINGNGTVYAGLLSERYKKRFIVQFVGSDINSSLNKNMKSRMFTKHLNRASLFSFNSKQLSNDFNRKTKLTNKENYVVYRGVKLSNFTFKFTPISSKLNVLFLGGFPNNTNLKGGYTLLKAFSLLDSKLKDCEVELSIKIGGPNSDKINFECNNINVQFLGAVNKDRISFLMKESHIVIIPSLNEGIPNVLYEAMASGNLLMCSRVGGIPEFINNEENGLLFSPDNFQEIADLFLEILKNPDQVLNYALAARNYINKFDYELFVSNYLKLYQKII